MNGLSGKTVVVTGGSSGIGAATVARFRDEGCTVFDLSRHPSPGGIACDVGDLARVEAAFAQIGRPDVVVNNAGVSFRRGALDITTDEWQQVLRTNLTGVFNVAQVAGRLMLGGGGDNDDNGGGGDNGNGDGGDSTGGRGGVIINVASTNALVGHPFYADYNATKAAVLALTRSLALEWAPTVRVTAICPGYVMTPMQEAEYTPEMIAQVNAKIPLGRHARPEELAALLAFMACDEAAYMTGSAVVIDGGETAGGLASR